MFGMSLGGVSSRRMSSNLISLGWISLPLKRTTLAPIKLALLLPTLGFLCGCVSLNESTHYSPSLEGKTGFGRTRIEVEYIRGDQDAQNAVVRPVLERVIGEFPNTEIVSTSSDSNSEVDTTITLVVGTVATKCWLWTLPPIVRSSSRIQYDLQVQSRGEELIHSQRHRDASWYYLPPYQPEEIAVQELEADLRAALTPTSSSS